MKENEKQSPATITLEVQVNMKTLDDKNVIIDAIASGSKLTKADAGRLANASGEDWLTVRIESTISEDGKFTVPKVETSYHSKETILADTNKS